MKYIARMQKVHRTKRVIEYCDDVLFVEINLLGTIEDLLQIWLDVFHDNEKVVTFEIGLMDNVFKLCCEHITFQIR
jgi:hypothetical protein